MNRVRRARNDGELDVRAPLDGLEQALTHILAEQLTRQEGMRERVMQPGMILALIELVKRPVQEIAGLARADREIAGAHIEEVQRVMTAIGDTLAERRRRLDQHEMERMGQAREAADRTRRSGEASPDNANGQWRRTHAASKLLVFAIGSYTGFGPR